MQNNRSSGDSVSVGAILSPGIRYFLIGLQHLLDPIADGWRVIYPLSLSNRRPCGTKLELTRACCARARCWVSLLACCCCFSCPWPGDSKLLDRLFSLPGLVRQHRYHAWIIALMALLHPLCVSIPEDRLLIPLEMRYWPEWIGVALLSLIVLQFVASHWRKRLKISFHTWMRCHRVAGLLAAALLIIHVLYVSETFETEGLPRAAVLIAAGVFLLVLLWIRTGWLWRSRPYTVARVDRMGVDCTCVELRPTDPSVFGYAPGQFAFVSFRVETCKQGAPSFHPLIHAKPARDAAVHHPRQRRLDPNRRASFRGRSGADSRAFRTIRPFVHHARSRGDHDRRRDRHHAHAQHVAVYGRPSRPAPCDADLGQSQP
jgi:hypothetical protein